MLLFSGFSFYSFLLSAVVGWFFLLAMVTVVHYFEQNVVLSFMFSWLVVTPYEFVPRRSLCSLLIRWQNKSQLKTCDATYIRTHTYIQTVEKFLDDAFLVINVKNFMATVKETKNKNLSNKTIEKHPAIYFQHTMIHSKTYKIQLCSPVVCLLALHFCLKWKEKIWMKTTSTQHSLFVLHKHVYLCVTLVRIKRKLYKKLQPERKLWNIIIYNSVINATFCR